MSDIREWSTLANDNSDEPPDGWPEGMDKSGVNDSAREMMAALKVWYEDAEWLTLNTAAQTVARDTVHQVRIDDVDLTAKFIQGRRVRVSGGGSTRMGFVESVAMSGDDTVVTINIDPNLGYGELASGIQLTFADDDPDTITAASGSPFTSLVDGDRVRVLDTESNDDTYELDSASGTEIILESSEAVTAEGPVDARIFQIYGIVPSGTDAIELQIGADQGDAAWRDTGLASGKVVVWDDLGDHAFEKAGEGDCDTVDTLHAEDIIIEAAAVGSRNLLVNGDFARWQEREAWTAVEGNDDGVYFADQWVLLSDGDNIVDVTRITANLPVDCLDGVKLDWETADEEAAIYQMIEQKECQSILGGSKTASLSFRIQGGPAGPYPEKMRAGIISWNGTADSPTSDPVDDGDLDWQGAGTEPDWKAGFTLEDYGEIDLTTSWQEFTLENVAIDTGSVKNVGVIIWSEDDTIAVGSHVNIARVRLVQGSRAIDLEPEPTKAMTASTHRFFCKTFSEATPPERQQASGALYAWSNANGQVAVSYRYPEQMRAAPSIGYFNPDHDSANPWDRIGSATSYVVSDYRTNTKRTQMEATGVGGYQSMRIQVTCNARFF